MSTIKIRRPVFLEYGHIYAQPGVTYRRYSDLSCDTVLIEADSGKGYKRQFAVDGKVLALWGSRTNAPEGEMRLSDDDLERILTRFHLHGVQFVYPLEDDSVSLPDVDHLARALHLCDPEVMKLGIKYGEAEVKRGDQKLLVERRPKVLETIKRMWERNEGGYRDKWMDMASRAVELLSHEPEEEEDDEEPDYEKMAIERAAQIQLEIKNSLQGGPPNENFATITLDKTQLALLAEDT